MEQTTAPAPAEEKPKGPWYKTWGKWIGVGLGVGGWKLLPVLLKNGWAFAWMGGASGGVIWGMMGAGAGGYYGLRYYMRRKARKALAGATIIGTDGAPSMANSAFSTYAEAERKGLEYLQLMSSDYMLADGVHVFTIDRNKRTANGEMIERIVAQLEGAGVGLRVN